MRVWWLTSITLAVGCFSPNTVPCGGLACPEAEVCSPDETCVVPEQLTACSGVPQGATCNYTGGTGFCHDQACVLTLDECGDGVAALSLDEQCDCGDETVLAVPPTGCTMFNSNLPGATCRVDCVLARCGDGIVDPTEQCDDGNNVSGDGCRADCQGRFDEMQTPVAYDLWGVFAFNASSVFAVGDNSLIHYNGAVWASIAVPPGDYRAVWASSATDVYLVGVDGVAAHYDGTTATAILLGSTDNLAAIWGRSATDIFVLATNTAVLHYNGSAWTALTLPATAACQPRYTSIVGTVDEQFIGTSGGICHGTTALAWNAYDTHPAYSLDAVYMPGAMYALDTTDAAFDTYDIMAPPPFVSALTVPGPVAQLSATSHDEVLAVGAEGVILQLELAAQAWTHLVAPTELQLNGIDSTSPTNVFIVGAGGTVLH